MRSKRKINIQHNFQYLPSTVAGNEHWSVSDRKQIDIIDENIVIN